MRWGWRGRDQSKSQAGPRLSGKRTGNSQHALLDWSKLDASINGLDIADEAALSDSLD
jgi:hypothetical protein